MTSRRGLFAGLAATVAAAVAAGQASAEPFVEEAQYYGPRHRRRRRRCWVETRRVPVRDRWGRLHHRLVQQEVCR
jgi:hypothetical protein